MRSPNDNEDPFNKSAYPGHFFEDDALYRDIHAEGTNGNFCIKIIKTCLKFLLCRAALTNTLPEHTINDGHEKTKGPTKMFSFTQLELGKITKADYEEVAVQTSENFEMMELGHEETLKNRKTTYDFRSFTKLRTDSTRPDSELNLIKFSKESKSSSQNESTSIESAKRIAEKRIGVDGELEIRNTVYDIHSPQHDHKIPVTCEVHVDAKGVGESKRLRFDEQLQMIPSVDDSLATTSTVQKLHDEDFDKIEEDEESFGREFMRFWGAKAKKGKKKKHLQLRL